MSTHRTGQVEASEEFAATAARVVKRAGLEKTVEFFVGKGEDQVVNVANAVRGKELDVRAESVVVGVALRRVPEIHGVVPNVEPRRRPR